MNILNLFLKFFFLINEKGEMNERAHGTKNIVFNKKGDLSVESNLS